MAEEQTPQNELSETEKLNKLKELKAEANELLQELNTIWVSLKDQEEVAGDNGLDYDTSFINQITQTNFFNWHKRFVALLEEAEQSELIDNGLLTKYKLYDKNDWKRDEKWPIIEKYYKEFQEYENKRGKLILDQGNLDYEQGARNKNYGIAALITSITVAIPLIIGLIFLIDNAITHRKVSALGEQKAAIEKQKETLDTDLTNTQKITPLEKDLYQQAAKVGTMSFFKPVHEAALKQDAKDEKQNTSGGPRPTNSPSK